jgi:hypothetical protein
MQTFRLNIIKYQMFNVFILLVFSHITISHSTVLPINQYFVEMTRQYQIHEQALGLTQYKRPLIIESIESDTTLKSEVYAVINYPFDAVQEALIKPDHWCDALILHINIKYCRMGHSAQGVLLNLNVGQKFEQPLPQTYQPVFNFKVLERTENYFSINLTANNGPLMTYDYDILLEAIPLENEQTFLRFKYAYSFGTLGKVAMQTYLTTIGHNKVGFTVSDVQPNGEKVFIKGIRGVIERNTMRYFLAIDAYLASENEVHEQQLLNRLYNWYDSTELYKVQLHEVERNEYIKMKQNEVSRQNTSQ